MIYPYHIRSVQIGLFRRSSQKFQPFCLKLAISPLSILIGAVEALHAEKNNWLNSLLDPSLPMFATFFTSAWHFCKLTLQLEISEFFVWFWRFETRFELFARQFCLVACFLSPRFNNNFEKKIIFYSKLLKKPSFWTFLQLQSPHLILQLILAKLSFCRSFILWRLIILLY